MPWAASMMRTAPSHAARARDTSYEKSTWPGVSMRLSVYSWPSRPRYMRRTVCALIVFPPPFRLQRCGEGDQPVGERRLAVIDVGDDREIANETRGHRLMVTRRVAV